ncbi:PREDICTED: defensin-like protein 293 [Camelina sativa]|uniref:Defensin-like protein 293 n=1 Tax=Camelina sativa TaxID=90675 RepID=A0ABM1RSS4_CAMSA|nr:PREDICTED: defensin-like protein 293 [Camelina sativa]
MASKPTSLFLFFFLISCTFLLHETNASRKMGTSYIPLCGSRDDCDGIWCKGRGGKTGQCNMWPCNFDEYCRKIVRCKDLPGPYCMEGICTC